MKIDVYEFTLTGRMPILMHADNIDGADKVHAWRKDPQHKNTPKGDDRYPPWAWSTYLYLDEEEGFIAIPHTLLTKMLVDAGKSFSMPGSRKNLKGAVAALLQFERPFYPLLVNGKQIDYEALPPIVELETFAEQSEAVKKLGFVLDRKRASVGTSKHVRTRPRFHGWSITGRIRVDNSDGVLNKDTVEELFNFAGRFCGICDYRPGARSPGPYGTFGATLKLKETVKA